MKALVTGATGFIGYHVAQLLRQKSFEVRALVRHGSDVAAMEKLGIELFHGDIRDFSSVCTAMKGCAQVYHLAADYRLWAPDPAVMYAVNVEGTKNVMRACRAMAVEKVIYTSSVGVLACSPDGAVADEQTPSQLSDMVGHYKRSKFIAEQAVRDYAGQGLPVVIVNPSTPVGPHDVKPTPTGQIIVDFLSGRIPAYLDTGLNFVDVADVAAGHWLASVHGKVGERYILGNRNMTLRQFFQTLAGITGRSAPRFRLPYFPVLVAAYANEALARFILHSPPRIPLTGVKMARKYMFFNAAKAVRDLHMPQSPLEKALQSAVAWFQENNYIKK